MRINFLALLLLCSIQLVAQDQWINYTNNLLITDLEEAEGELWIASQGGLVHVDKISGNETYYNRGNSDIPSNHIGDILLQEDGTLWCTTNKGSFVIKDEEITRLDPGLEGVFRLNPDGKIIIANTKGFHIQDEGLEFNDIIEYPRSNVSLGGFEIDEEGTIYVNGIIHFGETYVSIFKDNEWSTIYSDQVYETSLILDNNDNLILRSSQEVLVYQNNEWNTIIELAVNNEFSLEKLELDFDGGILIPSQDPDTKCNKLLKWKDNELTEIPFTKEDCIQDKYIKRSTLNAGLYYAYNYNKGLYSFTKSSINEFETYSQSPLASNIIIATLHADDGTNYIVTPNAIQKIENGEWSHIEIPQFDNYIHQAYYADGKIWIRNLHEIWTYADGQWENISIPNTIDIIKNMVVGNNDQVWLHRGTYLYEKQGSNWKVHGTNNHLIPNSIIKDIKIDEEKAQVWVSSFDGVRKYDIANSTWSKFDLPSLTYAYGLGLSPEGVYVYTGKIYLIKDDDSIEEVPFDPNSTFNTYYTKILYDKEDEILYITGAHSLAVFKDNNWTEYNIDNSGICNGAFHNIAMDNNMNIWLSGSQGGVSIFNSAGVVLSLDDNNLSTQNDYAITIQPNLVTDTQLRFQSTLQGEGYISIIGVNGQVYYKAKKQLHDKSWNQLDLPQLSKGLYFLNINVEKKSVSGKFIVE